MFAAVLTLLVLNEEELPRVMRKGSHLIFHSGVDSTETPNGVDLNVTELVQLVQDLEFTVEGHTQEINDMRDLYDGEIQDLKDRIKVLEDYKVSSDKRLYDSEQCCAENKHELGDLAEISACSVNNEIYNAQEQQCGPAVSAHCHALSAPASAGGSLMGLSASDDVIGGAVLKDYEICSYKRHFGSSYCEAMCAQGFILTIRDSSSMAKYTCDQDGWKANFECEVTKCPVTPPMPSGVAGKWVNSEKGTGGFTNTLGAQWTFECTQSGAVAMGNTKVTCDGEKYSTPDVKCYRGEINFWRQIPGSPKLFGAYKESHNPSYPPGNNNIWTGSCGNGGHYWFGGSCGKTYAQSWGWTKYYSGPGCGGGNTNWRFAFHSSRGWNSLPYMYMYTKHIYISFSYGRHCGGSLQLKWYYDDGTNYASNWGSMPHDCSASGCSIGNSCTHRGREGSHCCDQGGEARWDNPYQQRIVKYVAIRQSGCGSFWTDIFTITADTV